MPRFCEKRAVVEAERVTRKNIFALAHWCGGRYLRVQDKECIVLSTDEGPVKVSIGDWLIKDRNGRFYVCPPDVFEQNYKLVQEKCSCRHVVGVGLTDSMMDQIAERVAERLAAELQKAVTSP